MTEDEVMQIKERHSEDLLKVPGVHGVGIGQDEQGRPELIIIGELARHPDLAARLPHQIEGCPVRFVEGGPFQTLPVP
jgi:hypothetical protein